MRNFNQKIGSSVRPQRRRPDNRTPGGPALRAVRRRRRHPDRVLVFLVWLASGFYIVDASQRGMVLRFGKFVEETLPGPHWHLPYPIEIGGDRELSQVRTVEVGYRNNVQEQGAQGIAHADRRREHHRHPVRGAVRAQEVRRNICSTTASPMKPCCRPPKPPIREIVGKSTMDFVLYEGRAQIASDAQKLMQAILDRYQTGISISKVTMQNAQPPEQVQAAFDDAVQGRARTASARRTKARRTPTTSMPKARGTASRLAAGSRRLQAARDRAARKATPRRFRQIVAEYNKAPRRDARSPVPRCDAADHEQHEQGAGRPEGRQQPACICRSTS